MIYIQQHLVLSIGLYVSIFIVRFSKNQDLPYSLIMQNYQNCPYDRKQAYKEESHLLKSCHPPLSGFALVRCPYIFQWLGVSEVVLIQTNYTHLKGRKKEGREPPLLSINMINISTNKTASKGYLLEHFYLHLSDKQTSSKQQRVSNSKAF